MTKTFKDFLKQDEELNLNTNYDDKLWWTLDLQRGLGPEIYIYRKT